MSIGQELGIELRIKDYHQKFIHLGKFQRNIVSRLGNGEMDQPDPLFLTKLA